MLQKTAYKSVMHGFCRTAEFECLYKFLVFHEKTFEQLGQVRILYLCHKSKQLLIHFIDILAAHWQIVHRIVLALSCFSDTLDIQLHLSLKTGYIRYNIYIIQIGKIINTLGIGIPDLGICRSCLILQNYILIGFSRLSHRTLTIFTQINSGDTLALAETFNIFHSHYSPCYFYS